MKSQRTRLELLTLLLAIAVCFSAATAPKCGDKPPRRTQAEIDLDNSVTAKVRENLTAASPDVRATDIQITTFKLKVTLEGQVRSTSERDLAIKITRETEVVKDGATRRVGDVEAKDLKVRSQ